MKPVDNVGVTFINTVLGRGVMNGVVNLTFGVLQFTPTDDKIEPDLAVAARLRMDLTCAKQLHETLGDLLEAIEVADAKAEKVGQAASGPDGVENVTEKLN